MFLFRSKTLQSVLMNGACFKGATLIIFIFFRGGNLRSLCTNRYKWNGNYTMPVKFSQASCNSHFLLSIKFQSCSSIYFVLQVHNKVLLCKNIAIRVAQWIRQSSAVPEFPGLNLSCFGHDEFCSFLSWKWGRQMTLMILNTDSTKINRPEHNIRMYWTNFRQPTAHVQQNIFGKNSYRS